MKAPTQPPGLPEGMLEALPDAPGLYLSTPSPSHRWRVSGGRATLGPTRRARAESARAVREHFGRAQGTRRRAGGAGEAGGVDRDRRRVSTPRCARTPCCVRWHRRTTRSAGARRGRLRAAPAGCPGRRRAPIYETEDCGVACCTDPMYGRWRSPAPTRQLARASRRLPQPPRPERVTTCCASWRCCTGCARAGLAWRAAAAPAPRHAARRCAGVCAARTPRHDAASPARSRAWASGPGRGRGRWRWKGARARPAPAAGVRPLVPPGQRTGPGPARSRPRRAPRAFDADVWRILARWLAEPAHLAQVRVLYAAGRRRDRAVKRRRLPRWCRPRTMRRARPSAPRECAAATTC